MNVEARQLRSLFYYDDDDYVYADWWPLPQWRCNYLEQFCVPTFRGTGSYLICSDPCKLSISKWNYTIGDEIIPLSHIISPFSPVLARRKCDSVISAFALCTKSMRNSHQHECAVYLYNLWRSWRRACKMKKKCNSVRSPEGSPLVCRVVVQRSGGGQWKRPIMNFSL